LWIDMSDFVQFGRTSLDRDDDGRLEVDFVRHTAAQFVRSASEHSFSGATRILKPQALKQLYRGSTSV